MIQNHIACINHVYRFIVCPIIRPKHFRYRLNRLQKILKHIDDYSQIIYYNTVVFTIIIRPSNFTKLILKNVVMALLTWHKLHYGDYICKSAFNFLCQVYLNPIVLFASNLLKISSA